MSQSNSELPEQNSDISSKPIDGGNSLETNPTPEHSATTPDLPAFGWSSYAERVNGRFAMIGFISILMIELISGSTFIQWAGLL